VSAELASHRQRLLEERERVVAALNYVHVENAGSSTGEPEETPHGNHLAEAASVTLDREIDYSLEEASTHVLAAIDAALARIADGTYGTCVTCGRLIGRERLEAIPYATQCIDCRRAEERP
jgi:RNA polymerase-binding protein DksA